MDEMSELPWFPLYVNDFLGSESIAVMTTEEIGAYILLLCYAWNDKDCSIPNDPALLARMTRLLNGCSTTVQRCFSKHPTQPDRLYNSRLFAEWQKSRKQSDKCRRAGILSGKSRALALNACSTTVQPTLNYSQSDSQSQSQEEKEVCAEWEKFWKTYPDRNGKKLDREETRLRFFKLSPEDRKLVLVAVKHYANSQRVKEGIGIKDPKRFLRDGKGSEPWRDWIEPEVRTTGAAVKTCAVQVRKHHSDKFLKPCGNPIEPGQTACSTCRIAIAKMKGEAV